MIHQGVLILPEGCAELAPSCDPAQLAEQMGRLASAYLQDVRKVLVWHWQASASETKAQETPEALARFNALLQSRTLPALELRHVAKNSDIARRLSRIYDERGQPDTRRRLWSGVVSEAEPPPQTALVALQKILSDHPGALFSVVPRIDASRCTGCDACLRVCPEDVLIQVNDDEAPDRYHAAGASCDGCGLCAEICGSGAIELVTMSLTPKDIMLESWNCAACGVTTHAPALYRNDQRLCAICSQTGHHKKLFQVLS